ncbi:MAG: serine hydrolase domain-containing protein, partial [Bacteroidales bacterium]
MKIVGRFIISIALLLSTIYGFSIYRNLSADSGADVAPASMLHLNRTLSNELSELSSTRLFDKKVEQFMARWGIEGASFALIRGEELLYAKGYGWADRERGERCGPHNIFRVASLSKLITAVAIMKLCEEGKLTLESKLFGPEGVLSHSFPNYRDKRVEAITIEHLLRHRGGFSTAAGDPLFSLA